MKRQGILWMALGSLLTVVFNNYIAPIFEIIYGDRGNAFTLRSTKVQCEINEINRKDQAKQERHDAPLSNPIGFDTGGSVEEYYDDDDDYDDYDDRLVKTIKNIKHKQSKEK